MTQVKARGGQERIVEITTDSRCALKPSPAFIAMDAVETWDAEFRWREPDGLRDRTVDDTWRRVADFAAGAEGSDRKAWAVRFFDAFSAWRMLPGERALRTLGTDMPPEWPDEPDAVLNVAAFVAGPLALSGRFHRDAFVATASLTVRFLDDCSVALGIVPPPRRLRIGIIGLADALERLGVDYRSSRARQQAALVANALAEGCRCGSAGLARERSGRRHEALTVIDAHPSLARLANGVADGIDPLPDRADGLHAARGEMRAALQPWIDRPITNERT